LSNDGKTRVPI